ncbi:MAG: hypothetical protein U0324_34695 [Polyangiales bacterium]
MLADLVEQEVLRGGKMSRARLATWIRKAGVIRQLAETYEADRPEIDPADGEDDRADGAEPGPHDVADEAAGRVFDQLTERARCLAERYPFALTASGELRRAAGAALGWYDFLLALSVAHRYAVPVEGVQLDRLFERLVASCLPKLGFQVKHFGTAATRSGGPIERIDAAARELRLLPRWQGNRSLIRRRANDAGVDALGRLGAGDGRPGDWVLLAQTTVARSDDWNAKASEALHSPLHKIFDDHPRVAALAVPYHVATERLLDLTRNYEIVVFDRLRLTLLLDARPTSDGATLCEAVRSVEFEWS